MRAPRRPAFPQLTGACAALVEAVKDGSTLRVRLLMPEGEHQFINLALAGVRAPRAAAKQGEQSEPFGEEVPPPRPRRPRELTHTPRPNSSPSLVFCSAP